jgi:hypothetical protein
LASAYSLYRHQGGLAALIEAIVARCSFSKTKCSEVAAGIHA